MTTPCADDWCPLRGRPNGREPSVPLAAFAIAEDCTPDARLRPLERREKLLKAALPLRTALGHSWGAVSVQNSRERTSCTDSRRGMAAQDYLMRIVCTAPREITSEFPPPGA